jgi:hypothetical protein
MSILNLNELIRIEYREMLSKNNVSKIPKMDLIFDQLLNPPKIVRNPPDHRHIGMTTYYGIKFKNSKSV